MWLGGGRVGGGKGFCVRLCCDGLEGQVDVLAWYGGVRIGYV